MAAFGVTISVSANRNSPNWKTLRNIDVTASLIRLKAPTATSNLKRRCNSLSNQDLERVRSLPRWRKVSSRFLFVSLIL
jgi:hypothetical protein